MTWNAFIIILHICLRNWPGFPAQSRFKLDLVSENLLLVESARIKMGSNSHDKKRKKKKRFFKADIRIPQIPAVWHHLVQFENLEAISSRTCCNNSCSKHPH